MKNGEIASLTQGKVNIKHRGTMSFDEAERMLGIDEASDFDTSSPQLTNDGKRKQMKQQQIQEEKKA